MAAQRTLSKESILSSNSSTTSASQTNVARSGTPNSATQIKSARTPTTSSSIQDPAALIKAANGSPEAAIQKLLNEAQATAQRNQQLWQLVEKQRAMMLALNADLEKVAKDKERYKRKLKEKEQETVPPLPSVGAIAALTGESKRSRKSPHEPGASIGSETASQRSLPSHSRVDSKSSQASSTQQAPRFSHSVQSPGGSYQQDNASDEPPARIFRLEEPPKASSPTYTSTSSPQDSRRRGLPAPLDLSRSNAVSPTSQREVDDDDDSGSEYEDILNMDKASPVERGRLRSREDDDRQRHYTTLQEEARDRSNKSKGSKSRSKSQPKVLRPDNSTRNVADEQQLPAGLLPGAIGLPSSPRSNLLGGLQSPMQPPTMTSVADSLSSQLNARGAQDSSQRSFNSLKSPGLPVTPRPGDRPMGAAASRAPLTPGPFSPRSGFPLSPRAPKQPIPLPRSDPLALNSPHLARAEAYHQQSSQQTSMAERIQQTAPRTGLDTERPALQRTGSTEYGEVYRGFMSEQYQNLLLPPNALPLINVRVHSSRLRPSRNSYVTSKQSEDNPIFTLAIFSRADGKQLWRVEKTILALPMLDQSLRAVSDFPAKIPDRSLFSGHAPAKIDARTEVLNKYFETILDTQLDETAALVVCDFFSTDVIPPKAEDAATAQGPGSTSTKASPGALHRKEGYLTKRGKNFGGWKARFFVLEESELRYYESPGGELAGTIRLRNAQIGKQSAGPSDGDPEDQHRHTLLILEPKRKDSSQKVRHMLCAESDQERDAWVEALLLRTDMPSDEDSSLIDPGSASSANFSTSLQKDLNGNASRANASPKLEGFSYENTVSAGSPRMGTSPKLGNATYPSPPVSPSSGSFPKTAGSSTSGNPSISSPVSGGFIQNAEAWGNKSVKEKDVKKRNIFGFRSRGSNELPSPRDLNMSNGNREQHINERRYPPRAVFGIPLSEAAEYCPPLDVDILLPAPVYRCIEYLAAKNATSEEGIFRLNGSSNVIRALKDRFDNEGDIKLLDDGQYHDINAVASLLKQYLRELPASVLTRELHIDFLKILDIEDKEQKLAAINYLAHRLPAANFELLATLSRFLIEIVDNSHVNKMNVRNVGILFSPTLNIPAPLISLFIMDYDSIFGSPVSSSNASPVSPVIEQLHATQSSTWGGPDDIRSPRKQMFTDLPTPAYNQSSFTGLGLTHGSLPKPPPSPGYGNAFYQLQASGAGSNQSAATGQKDPRAMYDMAYASPPQRPSYESPQPHPQQMVTQVPEGSGYGNFGSLNAALAPPAPPPPRSPKTASAAPHTTLPPLADSRKSSSASASSSSFSFGSVDSKDAVKKSRRESSLLGPGSPGSSGLSGQRKSSMQRLREAAGMKSGGSSYE